MALKAFLLSVKNFSLGQRNVITIILGKMFDVFSGADGDSYSQVSGA